MNLFRKEQPIETAVVPPDPRQLLPQMQQSLTLEDVRVLAYQLHIDYDNLAGNTKNGKLTSLLDHLERHGRLAELPPALEALPGSGRWTIPLTLSPRELKNRENFLNNVHTTWIKGFLHQSLSEAIALELKLTYRPDAVVRKTLVVLGKEREQPVQEPIQQVFEAHGRALLILGEPGSGKTITLLQLAESLIVEAQQDPNQPMPVVLNLSSWALKRGPFMEWLVEEIFSQYQLAQTLTPTWIENGQLCFLLDGLDEVVEEAREACITAINKFKAQYPADMVVCSRIADYEKLSNRLNLSTAVYIQPLSTSQVQEYLEREELGLQAVRELVESDDSLEELAHSPLMLSIMTLAYRGLSVHDLGQLNSIEARQHHLFARYVEGMFARRPVSSHKRYSQKQAQNWLVNLAVGMQKHNQSIFYIERLQPTWLSTLNLCRLYNFQLGLIVALISALIGGLIIGLIFGLSATLIGALSIGPIFGLSVGHNAYQTSILLVEEINWPTIQIFWRVVKEILVVMLIIGLISGLIFGSFGLIIGLFFGLIIGLIFGLGQFARTNEISHRIIPNQGIHNSGRHAIRIGLSGGLIIGLFFGLFFGLISGGRGGGLSSGLIFGLILGLSKYGGGTVIKHYVLRWVLAKANILPFPLRDKYLVAYLDDMVDHLLLRRVGGAWVFVHRSLLEYFASLHPSSQENQTNNS